MMVAMDRAGRVVIPKDVRDRLDLRADCEVDLSVEGDSIRLTPARQRGRKIVDVDGWPVIQSVEGIATTDADVQGWRDGDQR